MLARASLRPTPSLTPRRMATGAPGVERYANSAAETPGNRESLALVAMMSRSTSSIWTWMDCLYLPRDPLRLRFSPWMALTASSYDTVWPGLILPVSASPVAAAICCTFVPVTRVTVVPSSESLYSVVSHACLVLGDALSPGGTRPACWPLVGWLAQSQLW